MKFLGKGEREVRVGYIQEAPVWKTSYRLVLDENGKPFLQGWAIVENTTDIDWKDVRLTLVSGRPISFVMDLYSPLYATRPTIVPELFASLSPQVYGQNLMEMRESLGATLEPESESLRAANAPARGRQARQKTASINDSMARRAAESEAPLSGENGRGGWRRWRRGSPRFRRPSDHDSDFESAYKRRPGGDVGELFQYDIKKP